MIYFDVKTQAFFDDTFGNVPSSAVKITTAQHQAFIDAKNNGCYILADLSISTPKPNDYSTWDGTKWALQASSLDTAKADLLTQANSQAQEFIKKVADLDATPDFEVATWAVQSVEAKAWHTDNNTPTPVLDAIAKGRGIDPTTLKTLAYQKSVAYEQLSGFIAGQRQAYETQINAVTNFDDLAKIKIAYTMPS